MKLKPLFTATSISLVLSSLFLANPAYADTDQTTMTNQQMQQTIIKLEQEVNALSGQISQLKKQEAVAQSQPKTRTYTKVARRNKTTGRRPATSLAAASTSPSGVPPSAQGEATHNSKLNSQNFTHGPTVTTSPYLGLRSAFDASDLVVNISTMNEDLRLLQQREVIEQAYRDAHLEPFASDRPIVELSGTLETQALYQDPYQGTSTTDIDLNKVELDTLTYVSPWVIGLISLDYDNTYLPGTTNPSVQLGGSGYRINNSRLFLKRGFITIGDLHRNPFYLTMGQMFVPFGDYTSELLSNPLTQSLGQTNQRAVLLGFNAKGLYAETYIFKGDSNVASPGINNGGGNIGYKHEGEHYTFNIGGGAIANIADALGMQNVSNPVGPVKDLGAPANAFQGFGFNSTTEQLARRVPGLDGHGELDVGKFTFVGEYVGAARSFDPNNLSFNYGGAKPQAVHVEGDYTTQVINWPTVFTLAYDHSWESLGLYLPEDSIIAEITTSFWKDTIEALELRHDDNYPSSDVSSGNGPFGVPLASVPSLGGSQNSITLQAGYYF